MAADSASGEFTESDTQEEEVVTSTLTELILFLLFVCFLYIGIIALIHYDKVSVLTDKADGLLKAIGHLWDQEGRRRAENVSLGRQVDVLEDGLRIYWGELNRQMGLARKQREHASGLEEEIVRLRGRLRRAEQERDAARQELRDVSRKLGGAFTGLPSCLIERKEAADGGGYEFDTLFKVFISGKSMTFELALTGTNNETDRIKRRLLESDPFEELFENGYTLTRGRLFVGGYSPKLKAINAVARTIWSEPGRECRYFVRYHLEAPLDQSYDTYKQLERYFKTANPGHVRRVWNALSN